MIIFLDEEKPYRSWVLHHREGFVIDWLRKPTGKKPELHRAGCATVKTSKSRTTHWTTGRHLKACSLDREELVKWAEFESGHAPVFCDECTPEADPTALEHDHWTKLSKEILDYVVEAAVIHLDRQDFGYDLTVADIAKCFDKSPAQLAPALLRLARGGDLRFEHDLADESDIRSNDRVFPTCEAMRTLPAFQELPSQDIEHELATLTRES